MTEIDLFNNNSENVWQDTNVDIGAGGVIINQEEEMTTVTILALSLTSLLVIPLNGGVMIWMKKKQRTLIDTMMIIDCVANVLLFAGLFLEIPKIIFGNSVFCMFKIGYRFFVNTVNRQGATASVDVGRFYDD